MLMRLSNLSLIIFMVLSDSIVTEDGLERNIDSDDSELYEVLPDSEEGEDESDPVPVRFSDDVRRILSKGTFEKENVQEIDKNQISFFLYNIDNVDFSNATEIVLDTIKDFSNFNPKSKLTFIVHGWMESRYTNWCGELTTVIAKRNESVIVVDWNILGQSKYAVAVAYAKQVGNIIGRATVEMKKIYGTAMEQITIVGHGLGAHAAGFAGKYVHQNTDARIFRIYALEAAGPLFIGEDKSNRLAESDAQSVVALHTDDGVFGYDKPIGTKDFYANGGFAPQPGCLDNSKLSLEVLVIGMLCSHRKARSIFIIANMNFPSEYVGTECDSYRNFVFRMCASNKKQGLLEDNVSARGTFYFDCEGGSK